VTDEALRATEFEEQVLRQTDLHPQFQDRVGFKEKFLAETAKARFYKIVSTRGEYLAAIVRERGRAAAQVLTDLLAAELAALYWPKNMYWRPLKPERFVRPVRWMVALLDHMVLPVEFAGVKAANHTYGHRILHGSGPVTVDHPEDYVGGAFRARAGARTRNW
jgi:glycyl-tRNA synthetase beta chain